MPPETPECAGTCNEIRVSQVVLSEHGRRLDALEGGLRDGLARMDGKLDRITDKIDRITDRTLGDRSDAVREERADKRESARVTTMLVIGAITTLLSLVALVMSMLG